MAWSLIQHKSAAAKTVDFTSTPTDGNLLICFADSRVISTLTAPSGWSTATNDGAAAPAIGVFYKIAATDGKTVTWTSSDATQPGIFIFEYSGNHASAPFTSGEAITAVSTSTSPRSGSLSTAASDRLLLSNAAVRQTAVFTSWINSFIEEESVQLGSGGSSFRGAVADVSPANGADSGCTSGSNLWRCTQVAFTPAAAGASPVPHRLGLLGVGS